MSGYYPLYETAALKNQTQAVGVGTLDFWDAINEDFATLSVSDGTLLLDGLAIGGGGGSGDMVLASVQTVTGAKTFRDATLLLRNVANTFSSQFTNTNTAARTYTLPDASGTVALTSDIGVTVTELDGAPSAVCTSLVFPTGAVSITGGVATLIVANSSHVHGEITNSGAIGTTANLPLITSTSGVVTVGTFGTAANSFCQGNDTRLSDARTPTAHNQAWSTITSTPTTLSGYGITDAISSITVREIDGSPSIAATTIEFSNGHVTDMGGGVARVSITGGGGGGGSTPTDITVANEATDTTCFVSFFTAATGDLGPKTNASLTYNSATSSLACTTFVGALTGNASTVTTNANLTGPVTSVGNATSIASDVALAGNPTTTTQAATDNSTRIATTAHVKSATSRLAPFKIDTTTTGAKKLYYPVPFACTITGWELVADATGSVVIDIWSDSFANYPPAVGDTITGSAKPTISSSNKASSTTLTGWTTALPAGHYLEVNVDSVTTITNVTLTLIVTRT
jgi:hypothetical protein